MRRLGLLILASVLLSSCAGQISKNLASWEGHNFNELIASWGPPNEVFADGRGGQVFVYTRTRAWTQPGTSTSTATATTYGNTTYATVQTVYQPAYVQGYTAYRMFWVDGSGTIYSWAWRGL